MDEVEIRASLGTRIAAAVVGLSAVILTGAAIVASGLGGLMIVPFTGLMGAAAVAGLRMTIRADSSGLLISNGLRTVRYGWDRVQGFRSVGKISKYGVYVLVDADEPVLLPFENLLMFGGKRRRTELMKTLYDVARRYGVASS